MIVGTAGHIDHGKSALVAALTGRQVDRLAEERRRGITIDLNFAPLDLGSAGIAGVVDVPGHEDFVRTMVAGASGVDLALLVVAADEGMMPQTEEHLVVLEQLGVAAGIPVITKSDLVEADWVDLVTLELGERLARSTVAFEEPIAVSARTGAGLELLRERIADAARRLAPRSREDLFRLPIDRAFSMAGVGTVVTGTAWSGALRVGDRVRVLPDGLEARVRSLESHGASGERSRPGARTAVGLVGPERSALRRGQLLVAEGPPWSASRALDVALTLDRSAPRALAPRTRVRVLLGTSEVLARVRADLAIEPGATGLARLALEGPLVARGGDRFVIRSYSPVATIGGGRVLDPMPPLRGPRPDAALAAEHPGERLLALIERRQNGVDRARIPILLGLAPDDVQRLVATDRRLVAIGQRVTLRTRIDGIQADALERVRAHHRSAPAERGISVETLRRALRVPAWLADAAIEALAAARRLVVAGGIAALPGFLPKSLAPDTDVDALVGQLAEAGLAPPTVAELEQALGRSDVGLLLRAAAAAGKVEAVERDRFYARAALDQVVTALRTLGAAGDITPAAVRDALGTSRKFVVPLLEWADRRGYTIRSGEVRRINPRMLADATPGAGSSA